MNIKTFVAVACFLLGWAKDLSAPLNIYIYINSTNIPPIMIINRIYEHQNLLAL